MGTPRWRSKALPLAHDFDGQPDCSRDNWPVYSQPCLTEDYRKPTRRTDWYPGSRTRPIKVANKP